MRRERVVKVTKRYVDGRPVSASIEGPDDLANREAERFNQEVDRHEQEKNMCNKVKRMPRC